MSFLVYAILVVAAAIVLFMVMNLIEAILNFGIVIGVILLLASFDGVSHYLEARGINSDLKVAQYMETALREGGFDVTEEIKRQYEAAQRKGLVPDTRGPMRDVRNILRDIQR